MTAPRLANGELRRMVAGALAGAPKLEHSPREIAKNLGRSSGAVGNALEALTAAGEAVRTNDSPRRYKANRRTAAAAEPAPTTPPPPAGTKPAPATKPAKATKATKGGPKSATGKAPAATPAPAPAAPTTGPVARPNGLMYHPRTLAGSADVDVLRTMRAAEVPVLLYGPPGTGKTSLIEAAFGDLLTVQGDGDTTVADFVGEYTQKPDGTFVFVHGPLVRAMREGRVLFIDDATLIPPTVLSCVYPAMDGRREIIIKANGGEVVTAASGFYICAGHNPGVHGAILSDALASRFAFQVQVSSDYDLAAGLGVSAKAVRVARDLSTRQGKGEIGWAPQLRELLAFRKIATATDERTAAANLIGCAPEEDRAVVAKVVRTEFGTGLSPLSLGNRLRP
ncbi:AAA family ATPase [Nocardia bovistercoris]|uniref:AAA family ATPase n=1 Tax=Nocardia bovistercoris TaxID=2785916 RepID=A0A931ICL7_9NOCA|nr:AAA family ATPase [Nocardia bovistercoris]MBH0777692.1 AAA family ATPase [Nocardia bovistercoris]